MTVDKSPASLAKALESWNRMANLPRGMRFYSSADWLRWFMGKENRHRLDDHLVAQLTDGSLAAKWLPETFLDWLIDGEDISESGRYITVSERLRRLAHVATARFIHLQPLPHGASVFRENDGPTSGWRDMAATIWATLPKNDSDIFDRPAVTEAPKLAHMAEQLKPLLDWRRMQQRILPSSTNWRQADNDNYDEDHADNRPAVDAERRYRAGPSPNALIKAAGSVKPTFRHQFYKEGKYPRRVELDCLPLFPTKMGKLKFSNGNHVESCRVWKGKKLVKGIARVPRGAIRHYENEFTELLGEGPDPVEMQRRLSYWTRTMSWNPERGRQELEPVEFKKAGRIRRKVLITPSEQAEMLAAPRPPITYCKPGLPCGHEDIGSQFIGGWISTTKGSQPPERWQDISDELSRQAEFERWAAALPPEQQKALNLAVTAANFQEVGEAFGKQGKNAERFGKKVVVAANDNLKKVMAA